MNIGKDFVIPTAILTLICAVAAGALVFVHSITQPIIDIRTDEAKAGALRIVLADADSFTQLTLSGAPSGVTEVYQANNGAGVAVAVEVKGYGSSPIQLMIGVKSDGTVERISVINHSETPDIGDRALTDDYLANYNGKDSTDGVDTVSGATITSTAVKTAVQAALNAATIAEGGEVAPEPETGLTEALIAQYFPGATAEVIADGVQAYGDEGYIVIGEGQGYIGPVQVAVLFDAEGEILWTVVVETSETPGIGDKVETDDYASQYVSMSTVEEVETVDVIAGSTYSSKGYQEAVSAAIQLLDNVKGA